MPAAPNQSPAPSAAPKLLAGLRVLDLSRILAGPWASQMLADYGADVLKVERPESGDDTRTWGPPWWGEGENKMSGYFACANRGKRSVAINLSSTQGAKQIRELAAQADILIENYKVGQLAKYGLDAASLQALNPRLIYCSITGYGQTGPFAHKAGYDFAVQAEGGLMSITGDPEGEPQKVGVAVVDLMTGVYACSAILAAVVERARTGCGRVIDAALLDVQVAMLANQGANQLMGQSTPKRLGNAHPNIVPYQALPTQDGYMVLAVGNDAQFARFCAVAGQPELALHANYTSNPLRVQHRQTLTPLLCAITLTRTTSDWVRQLEAVDVPCSPILDLAQVMAHPQVVARHMQVAIATADGQTMPLVANPMLFDGQRAIASQPPPRLNQDTPVW